MLVRFGSDGVAYHLPDRPAAQGGRGRFFRCVNVPAVGVKLLDDPQELAQCADVGDVLKSWLRVPESMLPLDTVSETPGGPPVGYLIPVAEGDPIGVVLNPAARAWAGLSLTFKDLVGIAVGTASGMAANHAAYLTEGDVNQGNRIVGRTKVNGRFLVNVIDTDSFAFRGRTSDGRMVEFVSPVGHSEYIAPEAVGKDLRTLKRGPASDVFGLAVLIWNLIKDGSHPYAWRHLSGGSVPSIGEIIKSGQWPFAPKTPLPGGVEPLDVGVKFSDLPNTIQNYFTRAFTGSPADRPTAKEWADALAEYEGTLPGAKPHSGVSPTAAARAFLSALAGMTNAANVLRAVNRLVPRLQGAAQHRAPNRPATPRTGPRRQARWWVAVAAIVAVGIVAVQLVNFHGKHPETPPAEVPPLLTSPSPAGRFTGVPLWDELDTEIQAERRVKP